MQKGRLWVLILERSIMLHTVCRNGYSLVFNILGKGSCDRMFGFGRLGVRERTGDAGAFYGEGVMQVLFSCCQKQVNMLLPPSV